MSDAGRVVPPCIDYRGDYETRHEPHKAAASEIPP